MGAEVLASLGEKRAARASSATAMLWLPASLLFVAAFLSAQLSRRPIEYGEVPPAGRALLAEQGIDGRSFPDRVRSLESRTQARVLEGENDHLVHFVLQSRRFTHHPRIEPAISAREFVGNLPQPLRDRFLAGPHSTPPVAFIPEDVGRRFRDFLAARDVPDQRVDYLKRLLPEPGLSLGYLCSQYARVMRFLYRKEFISPDRANAAQLYQSRGHSTDTQIESNFAVYEALAVLKAQAPDARISRVLIVGPGLDFAPRTDWTDVADPQCYQPFAVADALLGLGLSRAGELRVHCVDVNERVVGHLRSLRQRKTARLTLLSGIAETDHRSFTADYQAYFQGLGRWIGTPAEPEPIPAENRRRLHGAIRLHPETVESVSADSLNIVTQRYEAPPRYGLVVATNVLTYFDSTELTLALLNIEYMIQSGGWLIHNEARPVLFPMAETLGLPILHARTVLIAPDKSGSLFDFSYLHRKK